MSDNPCPDEAPLQWFEDFVVLFFGACGTLLAATFRQIVAPFVRK